MKKLQILGPGCPKCQELYELAEDVTKNMKIDCELEKITDIQEIVTFGVMMTPALVVDGEVKIVGKVPSRDEIEKMLRE